MITLTYGSHTEADIRAALASGDDIELTPPSGMDSGTIPLSVVGESVQWLQITFIGDQYIYTWNNNKLWHYYDKQQDDGENGGNGSGSGSGSGNGGPGNLTNLVGWVFEGGQSYDSSNRGFVGLTARSCGLTSCNRPFWNMNDVAPSRIEFLAPMQTLGDYSAVNIRPCASIYLAKTITTIASKAFGQIIDYYSDTITSVEIEPGFNANLPLGYCHGLTYSSLLNIISNYGSSGQKVLTLSEESYTLLAYSDISEAVRKGVTVAVQYSE